MTHTFPTRRSSDLDEPKAQDLEKITVTGTRIRGGSTPSPVITIDAEDIREEGFTDLGEVIRSLPQNFDGGQNPGAVNTSSSLASAANVTTTCGSCLTLLCLLPSSSLTLLILHFSLPSCFLFFFPFFFF